LRPGARLQPSTHSPAGPLQIFPEVELPHSESPSVSEHPQTAVARHSGLLLSHRPRLDPEHSVHAPPRAELHAGFAGSVQSASVEHAPHAPLVHTGAVDGQSAPVRHSVQTFAGEQRGSGVAH
jgi:hypothetical protein